MFVLMLLCCVAWGIATAIAFPDNVFLSLGTAILGGALIGFGFDAAGLV